MVTVRFEYRMKIADNEEPRRHRISIMEDAVRLELALGRRAPRRERGRARDVNNSVPASVMRQIALFMFLGATLPGTNRYEEANLDAIKRAYRRLAQASKEAIVAAEGARASISPPMFINGVLVIDLGTVERGA
jgi:hypothetical protein